MIHTNPLYSNDLLIGEHRFVFCTTKKGKFMRCKGPATQDTLSNHVNYVECSKMRPLYSIRIKPKYDKYEARLAA